ncbi:aminoglycoside N(3)-acetyltransferase [Microbispora rosea]|uniref:aminoglycoside N(3)-acetyltransferase n=1 Tax=Microbispora rosea TaxID=58117 RepID=UPI00367725F6
MFTRYSLARDLTALGVRVGGVLLVHASMRSIGRVLGGASAVVGALCDALGAGGTLVVLTATEGNSDTSRAYLRKVAGMTDAEAADYRASMPAFDPLTSPSSGMGKVAECVRTTAGAVRSAHPQSSFAAVGPLAAALMDGHAPECHLGEESPLARLCEVEASVLLIGVGYDQCTAFHLGEYRYTERPPRRSYRCVRDFGQGPQWWQYEDVVLDDGDFGELGTAFETTEAVRLGRIGNAESRLFPIGGAVRFAAKWLAEHRDPKDSPPTQGHLTYASFP